MISASLSPQDTNISAIMILENYLPVKKSLMIVLKNSHNIRKYINSICFFFLLKHYLNGTQ